MTAKEIDEEVRTWCINTIVSSRLEDWNEKKVYLKDNIQFEYSDNWIKAEIYQKSSNTRLETYYFHHCWLGPLSKIIRTKNSYEQQKLINNKLKELKNKADYDRVLNVYNSLPIKEIRRKKLEEIENDINDN